MSKKNIRSAFRTTVFERDKYTCQVCGKKWSVADAEPELGRVNAHHITDRNSMPGGGYVKENGITVCDGPNSCHWRCERFHISGGVEWETGLHPADLYKKIGSSAEKALQASQKLS